MASVEEEIFICFSLVFLPSVVSYRWPLANYTGGAEVDYGNHEGKVGCTVTTGPKPPILPYYGMSFDGQASSYVELGVGTESLSTDWAFLMFVQFIGPPDGTIFHYQYTGETTATPSYSDEIRIWLNTTHIMLTIRGSQGEDFGTVVVTHGLGSGYRTYLLVSHEYEDGTIMLRTLDSVLYNQDIGTDNVPIHQPARIKIGGSYGEQALPFKGTIVCFGMYSQTLSYDDMKMGIYSCNPAYWNVVPTNIDALNPSCPEYLGYFSLISKDSIPWTSFEPIYTVHVPSMSQCAATCLQEPQCKTFAFEKTSNTCVVYSSVYDSNLETKTGINYYKRRDTCC